MGIFNKYSVPKPPGWHPSLPKSEPVLASLGPSVRAVLAIPKLRDDHSGQAIPFVFTLMRKQVRNKPFRITPIRKTPGAGGLPVENLRIRRGCGVPLAPSGVEGREQSDRGISPAFNFQLSTFDFLRLRAAGVRSTEQVRHPSPGPSPGTSRPFPPGKSAS